MEECHGPPEPAAEGLRDRSDGGSVDVELCVSDVESCLMPPPESSEDGWYCWFDFGNAETDRWTSWFPDVNQSTPFFKKSRRSHWLLHF